MLRDEVKALRWELSILQEEDVIPATLHIVLTAHPVYIQ